MEGDVVTLQNLIVYEITGEDAQRQDHRPPSLHRHRPPALLGAARYYGEDAAPGRDPVRAEVHDEHGHPLGERLDSPDLVQLAACRWPALADRRRRLSAGQSRIFCGERKASKRIQRGAETRASAQRRPRRTQPLQTRKQQVPDTLKNWRQAEEGQAGTAAPAPAARRAQYHAAHLLDLPELCSPACWAAVICLSAPARSSIVPLLAAFVVRVRPAALDRGAHDQAPAEQVHRRVRQRHRHHRARRQVGPAAVECLQIIARESPQPIAGEFTELVEQQRVGVPLARSLRAHDDAHAAAGGALLRHRHRHPAAGRRQSVRGARQPRPACCATASACRPR